MEQERFRRVDVFGRLEILNSVKMELDNGINLVYQHYKWVHKNRPDEFDYRFRIEEGEDNWSTPLNATGLKPPIDEAYNLIKRANIEGWGEDPDIYNPSKLTEKEILTKLGY